MRKMPLRSVIWSIAIAAAVMVLVAGCNQNKNKQLGAGLQSGDHHALYDRSSLNNEDNTLGVKPKWEKQQASGPEPDNSGSFRQLDMNNPHLTKTFRFAPEISARVEQMAGVDKSTIIITENNAYVALVLDGHQPDKEAHPEMMANSITPKGGVGLFGTDKGSHRLNWSDPGGLSHAMSNRISGHVLAMSQPGVQRVFVSANPNFVQRIRFYSMENDRGVDLSVYMNEFNTMIQRVFPNDHNTRQ